MIDHTQYRRALMADPNDSSPELERHLDSCDECRQFAEQLLQFESRLERALRIDTAALRPAAAPEHEATVLPFRRDGRRATKPAELRPQRRGWMALAASFLLALCVGGGLWLAAPGYSLAADVVTHMAGEPKAWARTDVPVPDAALNSVLRNAHVRLAPNGGMVSYASACEFRGHTVPHLVVQTDSGPVTVMVLIHETVHGRMHFNEHGYRGVIVPVSGHGSLAILGLGESADPKAVDRTAARVLSAVEWTN